MSIELLAVMTFLVFLVGLAVVAIVLPILAIRRAAAAERLVEDLRRDLQRLERRFAGEQPQAQPDRAIQEVAETPVPAPPAPSAIAAPNLSLPSLPVIAPPGQPRPTGRPGSIESRIGSRWLLYVGTAALVLGVGFFVKHAFDNDWITPAARVLLGALAGLGLIGGGLRFVRSGYPLYGQILSGGGLAILYLSTYAAFSSYFLVGRATAFGLMVAITAGAALLADRHRSAGLAVMAVGGGFLTPFLVGGDADRQVTLFTYDALLVAGTVYLAHRRRWTGLNLLSFLLTGLTVAAWVDRFYIPGKYLPTELFLTLYCGMFLYVLRENLRSTHPLAPIATSILAIGPVAYHSASLVILFPHASAFLVYLIAFSVTGVIAGLHYRRPTVRLVVWLTAVLPLLGWIGLHSSEAVSWPAVATLAALYSLHLLAALQKGVGTSETLRGTDAVLFHLNGFGLFVGLYQIFAPFAVARMGALAGVFALANSVLAGWLRRSDRGSALQALALAFGLSAVAVGLQFRGGWVTIGWAAEGAAVMWIGLTARREWFRAGGAILLIVAILRFVDTDLTSASYLATPILNPRTATGLFIVSLIYGLAVLHRRVTGRPAGWGRMEIAILLWTANLLTVVLMTMEILSWHSLDGSVPAVLLRQAIVSVAWAIYAGALVAIGVWRRYAPVRYLGISLFGLTAGKVFLVDLSELGGIYRVAGFLALGSALLGASFLYQRFRAGASP